MNGVGKEVLMAQGAAAFEQAKAELFKYKELVEAGDNTWKTLGLIAGLSIVVVSFFGFLSALFGLGLFNMILYTYFFVAGAVLSALEAKSSFVPAKYTEIIRREALFLYRPYGRAAFYFLCGVLLISMGGFLTPIVGLYTAAVGAYIYYGSQQAFKNLEALKAQAEDPQALKAKFDKCDKNKDGYLSPEELSEVCADMGTTLNKNVIESALLILGKYPFVLCHHLDTIFDIYIYIDISIIMIRISRG